MVQVCQRAKTKQEMLAQTLEQYKEMYVIAKREFNKIITVRTTDQSMQWSLSFLIYRMCATTWSRMTRKITFPEEAASEAGGRLEVQEGVADHPRTT